MTPGPNSRSCLQELESGTGVGDWSQELESGQVQSGTGDSTWIEDLELESGTGMESRPGARNWSQYLEARVRNWS
jgi:hypothetical protein